MSPQGGLFNQERISDKRKDHSKQQGHHSDNKHNGLGNLYH